MVNPIILVISFFVLIITVRALVSSKFGFKTSYFVTSVLLFVYFMFGLANFEDTTLVAYYVVMGLFTIALNTPAFSIIEENKILKFGKLKFTGTAIIGVSIISGFLLTVLMFFLQTRTQASIIGVPSLSVINSQAFGATTFGALGFIENGFFLTVAGLFGTYILPSLPIGLFKIKEISKLVSIVIGSVLFGLFHLTAYGGQIGSMLWATSIFLIWGMIYLFSSELPGSTSHFWWNALLTLGKLLSIK